MSAVHLSMLATSRRWQSNFLAVLPTIKTHAKVRFRCLPAEARAEAISESIARAFVSYGRLAQKRRLKYAYPSSLASFSVQAVGNHRRVGGHVNSKDVCDPLAQRKHRFAVASITPWSPDHGTWTDLTLATRKVFPADQACFNLDFAQWLKSWPPRDRRIINMLAAGEPATTIALKFRLSDGRVSQFRRLYQASWEELQGLSPATAA